MISSNPPILIVFALAFAAYANRRPLHLLSIPGLSPQLVRIDPKCLVLRNDPRFRKLAGL